MTVSKTKKTIVKSNVPTQPDFNVIGTQASNAWHTHWYELNNLRKDLIVLGGQTHELVIETLDSIEPVVRPVLKRITK